MIEMWIGSYADTVRRIGIDGAGALQDTGRAVPTPAPSFLAVDAGSGTWYAVAETDAGTVSAFDAHGQLLDTVPSGGSAPCHLLVDAGTLWVSNYGDGTVRTIPLDGNGRFVGPAQDHPGSGSGPDPDRQDGPHAHFATAVGDEVWVADLGADVVRRFAGGGEVASLQVPAGCGPRHLAVLPDGAVAIATELDDGVLVVRDGAVVARVPATATPAPSGDRNYPSHIALVGELLVVAVRGADVLSTFRLDAAGPVHLADSPVGGTCPRHFAAVGEFVLVACQQSGEVTVLQLDQRTGRTEQIGRLAVPAPACVLPL